MVLCRVAISLISWKGPYRRSYHQRLVESCPQWKYECIYPLCSRFLKIQETYGTHSRNPNESLGLLSFAFRIRTTAYLSMLYSICQTPRCQLAAVARPIPYSTEKRMPCWNFRFVINMGSTLSIILLQKICTIPTFLCIKLVLVRIQVIRCTLVVNSVLIRALLIEMLATHFVMTHHHINVHQLSVGLVDRSGVVCGIDMRGIAIVVSVPGKILWCFGRVIYSTRECQIGLGIIPASLFDDGRKGSEG